MEFTWKHRIVFIIGALIIIVPLTFLSGWGLGQIQSKIDEDVLAWQTAFKTNPAAPFPGWASIWQERLGHIYAKTFRTTQAVTAFERAYTLYSWEKNTDAASMARYYQAVVLEDLVDLSSKQQAWILYFELKKKQKNHPEIADIEKALTRLHQHRDRKRMP